VEPEAFVVVTGIEDLSVLDLLDASIHRAEVVLLEAPGDIEDEAARGPVFVVHEDIAHHLGHLLEAVERRDAVSPPVDLHELREGRLALFAFVVDDDVDTAFVFVRHGVPDDTLERAKVVDDAFVLKRHEDLLFFVGPRAVDAGLLLGDVELLGASLDARVRDGLEVFW